VRAISLLYGEVALTSDGQDISCFIYIVLEAVVFVSLMHDWGQLSMILVGRIISDEPMDFCETSARLRLQITVEDGPHCNQSFKINSHTIKSSAST
jgi:hypothetical protein